MEAQQQSKTPTTDRVLNNYLGELTRQYGNLHLQRSDVALKLDQLDHAIAEVREKLVGALQGARAISEIEHELRGELDLAEIRAHALVPEAAQPAEPNESRAVSYPKKNRGPRMRTGAAPQAKKRGRKSNAQKAAEAQAEVLAEAEVQ